MKKGSDGEETTRHYTSVDHQTKAFGSILSECGVSNDTLGWWVTYPVEEVLGVMVAQTYTVGSPIKKGSLVQGQTGQVRPPAEEQQVLAELEGIDRNLKRVVEEIFGAGSAADSKDWCKCRWVFRADSTYVSVLGSLLAERPPADVTTRFLGGTNVVGHGFRDAYEPEGFSPHTGAAEVQANRHVIPTYYRYVDRVRGELLALLPPNTRVLIISDHGLRAPPPGSKAARLRLGFHDDQPQGAFLAAGPGIRELSSTPARDVQLADLETLGHIADVCPTLLAAVGIPFGEGMLGRPIARLFSDAFLEQHPLLSIPTHDDAAWLSARPGELTHEDPERLEQLRKLGYLDGQDG